ncbi:MAG: hypothetical protein V2B18_01770 [Pseudomonadota bacterium]
MGIIGVRQIWDEVPAWHFRVAQGPGPYELRIEETGRAGPENLGPYRGLFSVKCYPHPTDPVYSRFSFYERSLVKSRHFDEDNTPRFESRLSIPAPLFMVGAVEMVCDPEGRWTLLSLEGLDTVRTVFLDEAVCHHDLLDVHHTYTAGAVAREVPGWSIGLRLFDNLVSLFSGSMRQGPTRVVLSRSKGFEYAVTAAQGTQCVDTASAEMFCLSVLFTEKSDHGKACAANPECGIDAGNREVLVDFSPSCRCHTHVPADLPRSPHINPLWWSMAHVDFRSDLTSTCGCS